MNLARLLFPVLVALPLAAAAEPVRVTTQLTGQLDPGPFTFEQLGLGPFYDQAGSFLPYSLTINTLFDADLSEELCYGTECYNFISEVSYTFRVGEQTVEFATSDGTGHIRWTGTRYLNSLAYSTGLYYISLDTWLSAPAGSFDDDPLAPRVFGGTPDVGGRIALSIMPLESENPSYWQLSAGADRALLQVSVVPEPAGAAMLAAGLAVVALGRQRRWAPA